jgi:DNA-binding beta-propeller fold protein YncE
MHDLAYDAIHDEIVVTSPLTQAILTFRGGADGEEAPIRVIQGPKTGIQGVGATGKVAIDPDNNVIMLATPAPRNEILFFARDANGDVAPIRKIGGPETMLDNGSQREGGGNVPAMRVDPIHNLLLIPTLGQRGSNGSGGRVLIFDRNASGNVRPKATITGPVRTGNQFEVYGPNRLLIAHNRDALELWRIPESGESSEPPVRIPARLGRNSADTGIALDPAHKEVIIATAAGNTIMTFSVPEVFATAPSTR